MNPQETAEEKFGRARAQELRSEIDQLKAELEQLRSITLEIEDEP